MKKIAIWMLMLLVVFLTAQKVYAQEKCPADNNRNETLLLDNYYFVSEDCLRKGGLYLELVKSLDSEYFVDNRMRSIDTSAPAAARFLKNKLADTGATQNFSDWAKSLVNRLSQEFELATIGYDAAGWSIGPWQLSTNDQETFFFEANNSLITHCDGKKFGDVTDCDKLYKDIEVLNQFAGAMNLLVNSANQEVKEDLTKTVSVNVERWDYYFNKTQFQYPWELWANKFLLERWHYDDRDKYGNRIGYREPPSFKWMLFHPDIGISYLQDKSEGSDFDTALIFHWVGYETWSYRENGKHSFPLGVALTTTFVENDSLDRQSDLGLTFRYGDFSITWAEHGSDTVWTVNLNAHSFFDDKKTKLSKELKKIEQNFSQ